MSYLALKLYKAIKVVLGHQKKSNMAFKKSIDAIKDFDSDADFLKRGGGRVDFVRSVRRSYERRYKHFGHARGLRVEDAVGQTKDGR